MPKTEVEEHLKHILSVIFKQFGSNIFGLADTHPFIVRVNPCWHITHFPFVKTRLQNGGISTQFPKETINPASQMIQTGVVDI